MVKIEDFLRLILAYIQSIGFQFGVENVLEVSRDYYSMPIKERAIARLFHIFLDFAQQIQLFQCCPKPSHLVFPVKRGHAI